MKVQKICPLLSIIYHELFNKYIDLIILIVFIEYLIARILIRIKLKTMRTLRASNGKIKYRYRVFFSFF